MYILIYQMLYKLLYYNIWLIYWFIFLDKVTCHHKLRWQSKFYYSPWNSPSKPNICIIEKRVWRMLDKFRSCLVRLIFLDCSLDFVLRPLYHKPRYYTSIREIMWFFSFYYSFFSSLMLLILSWIRLIQLKKCIYFGLISVERINAPLIVSPWGLTYHALNVIDAQKSC